MRCKQTAGWFTSIHVLIRCGLNPLRKLLSFVFDLETNVSLKCNLDMWAVGCIFAELLTLKPLFQGAEVKAIPNPFQVVERCV